MEFNEESEVADDSDRGLIIRDKSKRVLHPSSYFVATNNVNHKR